MRASALLIALAGCGRIAFDPDTIETPTVFGSTGDDRIGRPGVDAEGNVYFAGIYRAPIEIGGVTYPLTGVTGAFVASLDPDLAVRWVRPYSGSNVVESTRIAVAPDGRSYVSGMFDGTLVLPDATRNSFVGQDMWIVQHDTNGVFRWGRSYGADWNFQPHALALAPDASRVTVGGLYLSTSPASFGALQLTASLVDNPFLLTLDPAGLEQWVMRMRAASHSRTSALRYRSDGTMCRGGFFTAALDYEDDAVNEETSAGLEDVYVGMVDASGTNVWSEAIGTPADDTLNDVAAVGDDCVFIGRVDGAVELGSGMGALVMRYRSDGARAWSRHLGGTSQAFHVIGEPDGSVLVAGVFSGIWSPDGEAIEAAGAADGYVVELTPEGVVARVHVITGSGDTASSVREMTSWSPERSRASSRPRRERWNRPAARTRSCFESRGPSRTSPGYIDTSAVGDAVCPGEGTAAVARGPTT